MIKVNLTQKIRIFPNPEQEEVLKVLSEKCRLIYNFALEERITAWKNDIKGINYFKQNKDLLFLIYRVNIIVFITIASMKMELMHLTSVWIMSGIL